MAHVDLNEFRLFGPHWKIMIPMWLGAVFILAFIFSFFSQASTLSLFFWFVIAAPIFDLMQRVFTFFTSGR